MDQDCYYTDSKSKASLVPAFPSHRMTLNQRDQITGSLMVDLSAAEKPTINNIEKDGTTLTLIKGKSWNNYEIILKLSFKNLKNRTKICIEK